MAKTINNIAKSIINNLPPQEKVSLQEDKNAQKLAKINKSIKSKLNIITS